VRLVPSVVLSAESPVNKWKDWLFFEVYSSKYAAAYLLLASTTAKNREKGSLSAFSTYLAKKHVLFNKI
jgi:hypothetical protein